MLKDHLSLMDILDINNFQRMQDDLSISTDMALLTVDYKGVPVTVHSNCKSYCHLIRQNSEYQDLCQKCDSRGGLEAARLQKPYIYICHRGIVDLAVPIIANDQYLGAMMAGQVRILDDSKLEWILAKKNIQIGDENAELFDAYYEALPIMSYEKIEAIGNVLFGISRVLVDRAELAHKNSLSTTIKQVPSYPTPEKDDLAKKIPTNYIFLKPAIEFLHQHIAEKVYIEDMSILCNVSESYFSKCFNKAFGMSFTAYQNKLKLIEAEQLLQNSSKNINQVSDQLGFENASYFIRLFKKSYGITPAMYKHLNIEKAQLEIKNLKT